MTLYTHASTGPMQKQTRAVSSDACCLRTHDPHVQRRLAQAAAPALRRYRAHSRSITSYSAATTPPKHIGAGTMRRLLARPSAVAIGGGGSSWRAAGCRQVRVEKHVETRPTPLAYVCPTPLTDRPPNTNTTTHTAPPPPARLDHDHNHEHEHEHENQQQQPVPPHLPPSGPRPGGPRARGGVGVDHHHARDALPRQFTDGPGGGGGGARARCVGGWVVWNWEGLDLVGWVGRPV